MQTLQPKLVAVDSYALSNIDDRIQCLAISLEKIALSLNAITPPDVVMAAQIHTAMVALYSDSEALTVICDDINSLHFSGLQGASDAQYS